MDKLDISILRELTQGGLVLPSRPGFAPSYREISKKLGVPSGTVRNRIIGMYKVGLLRGSYLYPNPNLLKMRAAAYTIEIPSQTKKAEVLKKLRSVEGLMSSHDFVGSRAWITFLFEDEKDLERKVSLYREIAGGVLSMLPYPPCPESVSRSDADLILRLSRNGLSSYAKLAREIGISERSLKRRISKISKQFLIMSLANVDYSAIEGSIPADLLIFFADEKARAEGEPKVLEIVKDYVILAALFDVVGMCSLVLPKLSLVDEIAEKVKRIYGVKQAWVEVVREHIHNSRVFVDYMQRQMHSASTILVQN